MNGKIYNVGGCLSEEFSTAEVILILYLYVEKFPIHNSFNIAEPVFVNFLKSPGIDSQPVGPVRQPYLTYRPARLHRLAESVPWNRFLGSLIVYKFGLSTVFQLAGTKTKDSSFSFDLSFQSLKN